MREREGEGGRREGEEERGRKRHLIFAGLI